MINNLMIPFMIFVVVIYGLKQKINVYDIIRIIGGQLTDRAYCIYS